MNKLYILIFGLVAEIHLCNGCFPKGSESNEDKQQNGDVGTFFSILTKHYACRLGTFLIDHERCRLNYKHKLTCIALSLTNWMRSIVLSLVYLRYPFWLIFKVFIRKRSNDNIYKINNAGNRYKEQFVGNNKSNNYQKNPYNWNNHNDN